MLKSHRENSGWRQIAATMCDELVTFEDEDTCNHFQSVAIFIATLVHQDGDQTAIRNSLWLKNFLRD